MSGAGRTKGARLPDSLSGLIRGWLARHPTENTGTEIARGIDVECAVVSKHISAMRHQGYLVIVDHTERPYRYALPPGETVAVAGVPYRPPFKEYAPRAPAAPPRTADVPRGAVSAPQAQETGAPGPLPAASGGGHTPTPAGSAPVRPAAAPAAADETPLLGAQSGPVVHNLSEFSCYDPATNSWKRAAVEPGAQDGSTGVDALATAVASAEPAPLEERIAQAAAHAAREAGGPGDSSGVRFALYSEGTLVLENLPGLPPIVVIQRQHAAMLAEYLRRVVA